VTKLMSGPSSRTPALGAGPDGAGIGRGRSYTLTPIQTKKMDSDVYSLSRVCFLCVGRLQLMTHPSEEEVNQPMDDELVLRDYYDPVRPKRGTRRQLARLEQQAILRQRALEAAANEALLRVEAGDLIGQRRGRLKLRGTYGLAEEATHLSTRLNHVIEQESLGNRHLEMIHRSFEATAALAANRVIYNYGTER
jgi:hypothetical protein